MESKWSGFRKFSGNTSWIKTNLTEHIFPKRKPLKIAKDLVSYVLASAKLMKLPFYILKLNFLNSSMLSRNIFGVNFHSITNFVSIKWFFCLIAIFIPFHTYSKTIYLLLSLFFRVVLKLFHFSCTYTNTQKPFTCKRSRFSFFNYV